MNKRGAVLHWIVLGAFAALGLFFVLTSNVFIPSNITGASAFNLLYHGFFEAELDAVDLQVEAQQAVLQATQDITQRGGFAAFSPYGGIEGLQLLNKGDEWPDPQLEEGLRQLVERQLNAPRSLEEQLQVTLQEGIIQGKQPHTIDLGTGQYYRSPLFFSLEVHEFLQAQVKVREQAKALVQRCGAQRDLTTCLRTLPENWHYRFCEKGSPLPASFPNRKVPFCVDWKGFPFQFALDIISDSPLSIEDISLVPREAEVEVLFPEDGQAEDYRLYITDKKLGTGRVENVDDALLRGVDTWKIIDIPPIRQDSSFCDGAGEAQPGNAYRCGSTVTYVLDKTVLPQKSPVFITLTATRGMMETEIASWAELS